jgi:glucose-1-phosphate cytidylyltransferase
MKKKIIAVVLCGGFGSRISELTTNTPKSLIKIKNKPLIWYSIHSLLKSGIKDIILPLGYKGENIRKYVLKNFKKNLNNIRLIDTGEKTEIFQRILKIKKQLIGYESFIIINSDTLFEN